MSSIESRIAAMELRLNPMNGANISVQILRKDWGDTSQQRFIRYGGTTWTQDQGESYEDFEGRVKLEALKAIPSDYRSDTLYLHAVFPKFTREKWIEKHHSTAETART